MRRQLVMFMAAFILSAIPSRPQESIDVFYRPERSLQGDHIVVHWTTDFPSSNGQATFLYKYGSALEGTSQQTATRTHVFHQDPRDEATPVIGTEFQAIFDLSPSQLSQLERLEIRASASSSATQVSVLAARVTVDTEGLRSYFGSLDLLDLEKKKTDSLSRDIVQQSGTIAILQSKVSELPSLSIDVHHVGIWKATALVELKSTYGANIRLQAFERDSAGNEAPRGAPAEHYVSRGIIERFYLQPLTPETPFRIKAFASDAITGKPLPLSREWIEVDDQGNALRTKEIIAREPRVQAVQQAATYNSDSGQVVFSVKTDNVQDVWAAIVTADNVTKKEERMTINAADWSNNKDVSLKADLSPGQYTVRLWALNPADGPSAAPARSEDVRVPFTVSLQPVTDSVAINFNNTGITFTARTDTKASMIVKVGSHEWKESESQSLNPTVTVALGDTISSKDLQFAISVKAADNSRRAFTEAISIGVSDITEAGNKDLKKNVEKLQSIVKTGKAPSGEFWKSGLGTIIRLVAQVVSGL